MKIAIITSGFFPVIDGVTITGYSRVKELSKQGHQVLVFCPDYSQIPQIYPNWQDYTGEIFPGVRVVNLPSTSFFVEFERNVAWYAHRQLEAELTAFKPDLIHVDEPERLFVGFWRIPGLRYAKQNNIPCISFFRTNFIEYLADFFPLPKPILLFLQWLVKQLILYVYNAYDLTLVTSKITVAKIKKLGIRNTHHDNFLGLELDTFANIQVTSDFFAKEYNLPQLDDKIKLVFVGRLTPEKGWKFTLDNLPRIAERIDLEKVALLIVGDGELRERISQVMEANVPYFHLFGRVQPQKVPQLIANSGFHVTTSEKETRGLTILEAFAAGITVIAPNSEGVVESIDSGVNGFLYQPGDVDDFIEKLKTLIEDRDLCKQMGLNGKLSIENQYTWDATVRRLLAVWQQQIDNKE